jgi:hypothetical protein
VGTWCPARKLWLAHPAVDLGCVEGVATPGRPKVIQDLEGLEASQGLFSLFLHCRRGHSHCACGASITQVHPKDLERRVDDGGGRGSHFLLLELAVFTEASGKKSEVSADLFFAKSGESGGGKKCNTLVPTYMLPGL